jgi:hypothetical protein
MVQNNYQFRIYSANYSFRIFSQNEMLTVRYIYANISMYCIVIQLRIV